MARDREAQPHRKENHKKRAFQVGPKLAKGAYTGHAQRIKKTLIHKAKVKKEYAKALKEAGYSNERRPRGSGSNVDGEDEIELDQGPIRDQEEEEREKERLRRRLYGDDQASDDNDQSDDDDNNDQGSSEDEFAQERKGAKRSNVRNPRFGAGSASPSPSPSPEPESAPAPLTRGLARSREPLPSQASAAKDGKRTSTKSSRPVPTPKSTVPPKPQPQSQQQPKRPKLTEQEVEKLREKKRFEKRQAGQKTQRGQAKLGAKMEGLLGKIQRSLAK
ncbi:uncharacterized protein JCM15063_002843 [Sporobolomyces koalae]|uniref:uncharacterized protein n=1 Tax=Sporobolomyces koalae TaxID=500713 RepID=UPI0031792EB6